MKDIYDQFQYKKWTGVIKEKKFFLCNYSFCKTDEIEMDSEGKFLGSWWLLIQRVKVRDWPYEGQSEIIDNFTDSCLVI